jgi:cell wall-associated NlpC family hydrolase
MKYFFEDKDRQEKLKRIMDEWVGTPHRHHCGVKGLGTDCIYFVVRVLEEMKILRWRKNLVPDYPPDWHMHNTRELLKEGLEREIRGEWVDRGSLMNGDIVLSHFGKAASHSGIYLDGSIYQSLDRIGVRKIDASDRWMRKHMKFAYRILA